MAATLHEICSRRFTSNPSAVYTPPKDRQWRVIVLTAGRNCDTFFYLAEHPDNAGRTVYTIWRPDAGGDSSDKVITSGTLSAGAEFDNVISSGLEFPGDGRLFGWVSKSGAITGFLLSDTEAAAHPGMSMLVDATLPVARWPQVTGREFGPWFWQAVRLGRLVDLSAVIRATPRAFYWVDGGEPATRYLIVTGDLPAARYVIPPGPFAWYRALQDGHRPPPAGQLLASRDHLDLASVY